MKRPSLKQISYVSLIVMFVLTAAGVALRQTSNPSASPAAKTTKASQTSHKQTNDAQNSSAQTDGTNTKPGSTDTSPSSPACQFLTLEIAQKVIGAEAKTAIPANVDSLKANGTSLAACAYGNSSATVQLTIRTADTSLGASKNATVFGSERPASAITLQGYGQSAYWDPKARRLNILSSNDWYNIVTSSGTQADAEKAATELAARL